MLFRLGQLFRQRVVQDFLVGSLHLLCKTWKMGANRVQKAAKGETAPGTSLTYLFIMILFKAMRKQAESFLEAGEASAD